MIKEAVNTIQTAFNSNKSTSKFYKIIVCVCIGIGTAIAFLAAHVNIWLAMIELVIGTGLYYSIRGIKATDDNNVIILQHSYRVLQGVNNQIQLRRRLVRWRK